jgi:hypothetical protein
MSKIQEDDDYSEGGSNRSMIRMSTERTKYIEGNMNVSSSEPQRRTSAKVLINGSKKKSLMLDAGLIGEEGLYSPTVGTPRPADMKVKSSEYKKQSKLIYASNLEESLNRETFSEK